MRTQLLSSLAGALLMTLIGAPTWSAGSSPMSGGGSFDMPQRQRTPADMAKDAYNSGISHLKDAKGYDDDAQKATDPKKLAKVQEKSQKSYQKALKEFNTAVAKMPT